MSAIVVCLLLLADLVVLSLHWTLAGDRDAAPA
jgi:hypothetical protein